jgi:hypothetical protein
LGTNLIPKFTWPEGNVTHLNKFVHKTEFQGSLFFFFSIGIWIQGLMLLGRHSITWATLPVNREFHCEIFPLTMLCWHSKTLDFGALQISDLQIRDAYFVQMMGVQCVCRKWVCPVCPPWACVHYVWIPAHTYVHVHKSACECGMCVHTCVGPLYMHGCISL